MALAQRTAGLRQAAVVRVDSGRAADNGHRSWVLQRRHGVVHPKIFERTGNHADLVNEQTNAGVKASRAEDHGLRAALGVHRIVYGEQVESFIRLAAPDSAV